jgi:hypothetical protein
MGGHSIPVTLVGRDEDGMWWYIASVPCPDCGEVHRYPAGDGDEPLPLGRRATKYCSPQSVGIVELYVRG